MSASPEQKPEAVSTGDLVYVAGRAHFADCAPVLCSQLEDSSRLPSSGEERPERKKQEKFIPISQFVK
eukprot:1543505-Rhodomonas_salina.1